MPKTTKDTKKEELEKKKTKTKTVKKATKKTTTKKATTKKEGKKTAPTKKTASTKKTAATKEKSATKKVATKKATSTSAVKSTAAKKKVATTKKAVTKTTTKKKTTTAKAKKLDTSIVAEYYDLPYRYNETIVKILYQTPTILFVYWDISDDDRTHFVNQYGDHFFNTTYPVLKIYNLTMHYDFEVPINDFANSWYINVNDAGCDYRVELYRKSVEVHNEKNPMDEYVYVSSSNQLEFPNDHILLEKLPTSLRFRNVKTNEISLRNIATLHFVGIKNIHNIYDFYKKLYHHEILDEINHKKLINPSSMNSSWS